MSGAETPQLERRTYMVPSRTGHWFVAWFALAAAAVPLAPQVVSAQAVTVRAHAGATASSLLVRDQVANAAVRQLLGGRLEQEVRLAAAPGVTIGAGVHVPLRPRLALDAGIDWTATELRVSEETGDRRLQSLSVVEAGARVSRAVRQRVELGGGMGLVAYVTERQGLFRDGSRLAPMVEGSLAWALPVAGDRVGLIARGQLHRFGTQAIREAGGADGTVGRLSVQARVRLMELGR